MKTLLKRTVAVLAAVTMLLATLPVVNAFAATVYSSDSHLRAEYLIGSDYTLNAVTGLRDLSVSGSGVTWDENNSYAHFLGNGATGGGDQNNYLYVTKETMNTLLANTNASQGLSLSFAGRGVGEGWHRFLDYITGDPLQTNCNSNEYIYFSTNKNIKAKANGSETDAVGGVNDTLTWHVWTITVKENTLTVYRDGSLCGTVTNSNMNASWFNTLVSKGTLLLGASAYNDPGFNGYMRDFRIYDIALTADQAAEVATDTNNFTNVGTSTDLSGLKSAIATYENKLKNIGSDFYTNTLPAYEAYVYANRIVDAIECGELSADSSDTIALQLQRAERSLIAKTNAISTWSYVKLGSTATGTFVNDVSGNVSIADGTFNSLLYASNITANDAANASVYRAQSSQETTIYESGLSQKQVHCARLFHPTVVMFYDGSSNPVFPVYSYPWCYGRTTTFDCYFFSTYISAAIDGTNMNGLSLMYPRWKARSNNNLNFQWLWQNESFVNMYSTNVANKDDAYHYSFSARIADENNIGMGNLITFDGSKLGENEYTRRIKVSWGFNFSNKNDPSNTTYMKREVWDGSKQMYVVNYVPIKTAISGARSYYNNNLSVTNYKEGGLSAFFAACDALTAIDPVNGYTWDSTNSVSNVSALQTAMSGAVSSLNTAKSNLSADVYTNLRDAMLNSHTAEGKTYNGTKEDYHNLGNFTTSTIGNFVTAHETARDVMAALATNGYGSLDTSVLENLERKHHQLAEVADFTALDAAYAAQTARLADSTDMQQYTSYSVQQFSDALASDSITWTHKTDAEKANTSISEQPEIDKEKTTVDAASNKLDKTKSLTNLNSAHDRADDLLTAMDGQTVYMTKNDVEDLINATTLSNSYLNADAATKREFGEKTHGASIDDVTADINGICKDYEDGKYTISNEAIQVLDKILTTAEKVDRDVYVYNTGELERQVNTVKRMLFATPVNYVNDDGDTVSITPLKSTVTNNVMDAASALLLSSLNSHVHEYTVNIIEGSVSDVNGITFTGGSYSYDKANDAYTVSYGATVTFRSDSEDTAWYLEFDSETTERQTQFQGTGKVFSQPVIGNMKVSVRTATANTSRLTIRRNYSDSASTPIQLIDYVDGEYTLPTPTALSFYNFDSYEINGVEYAVGDTITVTEDTEVIANYTADDSKVAYTVSNKDGSSKTAYYNDKVTFNGTDSTYAWLEQVNGTGTYRPFYIGQNVSFRVSESTALKAVTEEEFKNGGYTLPTVNVRQSGSIATEVNGVTKRNFVGQIVTDGSVTVLEYGMLIGKAKAGGSLTDEDIALENSGSNEAYTLLRAKSTMDEGAHQFTIIVNGLSGDVKYRGYLIYQDANGTHNVYTDVIDETV